MTIRDYILARTGEAGGEVEGAEFAYSASTGRSGVGEAVGTASRVSPGPAEWFSGKSAGGLGLLPLLPFLGNGGSPEGMEEAYNEAYGQRAQEVSLQDQRQIEIEQKAQAEEEVREQQKKHLSKPMELEKFTIRDQQISEPIQKTAYEDFYRKPAADEQIQRQTITLKEQQQQLERLDILQNYPEAQKLETLDITKEYPEAQKLETLDVTKEYPEAQRMETLDITKQYPEAQRIDERQVKQSENFQYSTGAGRSFGEPITAQQQAMEQAYRKAMDPERNIFERMANYAAYEKEKTASSPARMAAEVGAYGLAAPAISAGSAALASGVASIPTAVSLGAEKVANTISSPASDYEGFISKAAETVKNVLPQQMDAASKVSQLGTILNPYNIAKGAAGAAAALGGVISSLGAYAESPAISSPGTSGNWDATEQKVTGTAKPISTGTVSKSTGITTKISKVK